MGELNNDKFDWLIKLLVVGDSGVGKTNILLRCCEDQFLTYNLSTIGITLKKITL
jgi:GTPase SAR1 family protein